MRGEVLWTAGVGPLGYSDIDDNKYRASTRQTHPKSMLYPTYSIYIYRKGPFNSRILPFYFLPLSVRLVVYKLNRMNHNNYDYLFKYIVVGDASKSFLSQVLENPASSFATPNNYSKMIMNLHLESSSHQK